MVLCSEDWLPKRQGSTVICERSPGYEGEVHLPVNRRIFFGGGGGLLPSNIICIPFCRESMKSLKFASMALLQRQQRFQRKDGSCKMGHLGLATIPGTILEWSRSVHFTIIWHEIELSCWPGTCFICIYVIWDSLGPPKKEGNNIWRKFVFFWPILSRLTS